MPLIRDDGFITMVGDWLGLLGFGKKGSGSMLMKVHRIRAV